MRTKQRPIPRDTWMSQSRRVIEDALQDTPTTATEKEIRAILKPLYPFDERRYHPYKQWCRAVREAIEKRLPKMTPEPLPPSILFGVYPCFKNAITTARIANYVGLRVWCNDCCFSSNDIAGCLMCRHEYDRAYHIARHPDFCGLCKAMRLGDPLAKPLLIDWLIEHDAEDIAEQVRQLKLTAAGQEG